MTAGSWEGSPRACSAPWGDALVTPSRHSVQSRKKKQVLERKPPQSSTKQSCKKPDVWIPTRAISLKQPRHRCSRGVAYHRSPTIAVTVQKVAN